MASNPNSFLSKVFSTNHRVLLERRLATDLLRCHGVTLVIGAGHDPSRALLLNSSKIVTSDIDASLDDIDLLSSAENIPLPDGSVDSVVSIEVFEHVEDLDKCLEECARLLAPGGLLYFTMPVMFHLHADPVDYRRLTKDGVRAVLPQAFSVESMRYYGNFVNVICDIISSAFAVSRVFRPLFRVAAILSYSSETFPSGITVFARKN